MMSAAAERLLTLETPFGRPVRWAETAVVTDAGDSHELNDDRCLVLSWRGVRARLPGTSREFLLCLLADGATGSTFAPGVGSNYGGDSPRQAGWRASQVAQAAFLEQFLVSAEVDMLDRLKDGLRAADRTLLNSGEGQLSTTLVVLCLADDGRACAASIGDSVLLVLPPHRRQPSDRRVKKLGYEDGASVGGGDTLEASIDESQLIEQWWPHKEGGGSDTRLERGTFLVLLSDGIADNLPFDIIDALLRRHSLQPATLALPVKTRERRVQTQKRAGSSIQQLGLDNMSAVVVRFDGLNGLPVDADVVTDGALVTMHGTHGGPTAAAGGSFGLIGLFDQTPDEPLNAWQGAGMFLRSFLESEHRDPVSRRLEAAHAAAAPLRVAALLMDETGQSHAFSAGGATIGPGGGGDRPSGRRLLADPRI
jgi:serine/threonine protein phosphatase PrpC